MIFEANPDFGRLRVFHGVIHRFLGDEPHAPSRLSLARRTAHHGDDPLALARVQYPPLARTRLLIQRRVQPLFFVAPGDGAPMKLLLIAVGQRQPAWIDAAYAEFGQHVVRADPPRPLRGRQQLHVIGMLPEIDILADRLEPLVADERSQRGFEIAAAEQHDRDHVLEHRGLELLRSRFLRDLSRQLPRHSHGGKRQRANADEVPAVPLK